MVLHQHIILKLTCLHISVGEDPLGLAVEPVYLELALFKSPIRNKPTISIKLMCACLEGNQLPLEQPIGARLVPLANDAALAEVLPILNRRNLLNPLNPKILAKLKFLLLQQLLHVEFGALVQVGVEELSLFILIEDVANLAIQYLLDDIDLIPLLEAIRTNPPILQLHLQHLPIIFLFLVKLAAIANKVNHHRKGGWVAVDEELPILHLHLVPPTEHGLQCAALDLAQRRFPDIEVFLSRYVELHNIAEWLYLRYPLFLIFPRLLLSFEHFSLVFQLLLLLLDLLLLGLQHPPALLDPLLPPLLLLDYFAEGLLFILQSLNLFY